MYAYRNPDPLGWDDLFRGFERLFQELDRDSALSSSGHAPSELAEEDERFVLRVEVPGLVENDVRVDFDKGVLTVSAERALEHPEGYAMRRRERSNVRFSRSFALGDAVDPEKTTAELKDGVLTVSIGKAGAQKKRTISVKVS